MRPALPTFLSLSLSLATVAWLAGCNDCRDLPCGPRVIARLNLPAAADTGAMVAACHVDDCATTTLPAPGALGSHADLPFSRADVYGSLVTRADGSRQLVVNWTVGTDGDRYTIVVRDAAGAELASLDERAMFPVASLSSGACLPCVRTTLGDPA